MQFLLDRCDVLACHVQIAGVRELDVAVFVDQKTGRGICRFCVLRRLAKRSGEFRVVPHNDLQHIAGADLVSRRFAEQRERLRWELRGRLRRVHLAQQREVDIGNLDLLLLRRFCAVIPTRVLKRGWRNHPLTRYFPASGKQC